MTRPAKIVSGGQTGVDRAALDAALAANLPHGGWCPAGRKAEDGPLPERYALTETESDQYPVRTRQNVIDSDGTLILTRGELTGGTKLTAQCAEELQQPLLVIDLASANAIEAIEQIRIWLAVEEIDVLNIAGPRESQQPGIYVDALDLMQKLLG